MVVGGIVFRVITFAHPGDRLLDAAGAPPIRTEYLATDESEVLGGDGDWTLKREEAHFFLRHLDAEVVAQKIGPRCHTTVSGPPDQASIPERLQPVPEPLATERIRAQRAVVRRRKKTSDFAVPPIDGFRLGQCRRDPVEAE